MHSNNYLSGFPQCVAKCEISACKAQYNVSFKASFPFEYLPRLQVIHSIRMTWKLVIFSDMLKMPLRKLILISHNLIFSFRSNMLKLLSLTHGRCLTSALKQPVSEFYIGERRKFLSIQILIEQKLQFKTRSQRVRFANGIKFLALYRA
jgi:hypothetical protein